MSIIFEHTWSGRYSNCCGGGGYGEPGGFCGGAPLVGGVADAALGVGCCWLYGLCGGGGYVPGVPGYPR